MTFWLDFLQRFGLVATSSFDLWVNSEERDHRGPALPSLFSLTTMFDEANMLIESVIRSIYTLIHMRLHLLLLLTFNSEK